MTALTAAQIASLPGTTAFSRTGANGTATSARVTLRGRERSGISSAIVAMILALIAIIGKRERSFFFIPLLLLGLFALLWALAVMLGENA